MRHSLVYTVSRGIHEHARLPIENDLIHGNSYGRCFIIGNVSVCTSGPLQKWHVQVAIVISCHLFAGALDAPSGRSVSYHAVCAVISVSSDVKA